MLLFFECSLNAHHPSLITGSRQIGLRVFFTGKLTHNPSAIFGFMYFSPQALLMLVTNMSYRRGLKTIAINTNAIFFAKKIAFMKSFFAQPVNLLWFTQIYFFYFPPVYIELS